MSWDKNGSEFKEINKDHHDIHNRIQKDILSDNEK